MMIILQQTNELHQQINEKIANAPDASYKIGVWIGNFLPFLILVILAYLLYAHMKNNADNLKD